MSPAGKQNSSQGRRRAYWGTSKHPELLLYPAPLHHDDPVRSKVQTGSMEAFAHELIFFTCFDLPEEPTEADLQRLIASHASFVDTIAFAHRRLSTTTKFVAELLRCVQMAKNAANSLAPSELRSRALRIVARLVDTYLGNIKEEGQECRGALLEIVELVEEDPEKDEETQRILQTLRGNDLPQSKFNQTTDWSRLPPSPSSKPQTGLGVDLSELQLGLTPALLLKSNAEDVAATLHAFHYDALRVASQHATCKDVLTASEVTENTKNRPILLSLFAFTPSSPHFVTLQILRQIVPLTSASATLRASTPIGGNHRASSPSLSPNLASARISSPVTIPPSPAHHRATIIQKWIAIGEASRLRGDAAAFMAVAMAICSRSIARLMQSWRRVTEDSRALVRDTWVPILAGVHFEDSDTATIQPLAFAETELASHPVPFLGSVLDDLHRYADSVLTDDSANCRQVAVEPLFRAAGPLYQAVNVLSLLSDLPADLPSGGLVELAAVFQDLATRSQPGPNQ